MNVPFIRCMELCYVYLHFGALLLKCNIWNRFNVQVGNTFLCVSHISGLVFQSDRL